MKPFVVGIRHTVADKNGLLRPPALGVPKRVKHRRRRRQVFCIRCHLDRCVPHGVGYTKVADRPLFVTKHTVRPKLHAVRTHAKQNVFAGRVRSGEHERPSAEGGVKLYGKTVFIQSCFQSRLSVRRLGGYGMYRGNREAKFIFIIGDFRNRRFHALSSFLMVIRLFRMVRNAAFDFA